MDTVIGRHIEITPGICGGKPRIAGHRIRVQDIAIWHERLGMTPDEIVARFPQLTLADIYAALTYYFDHQDEIRKQIREDDEYVREAKERLGPGPFARKLLGTDIAQ